MQSCVDSEAAIDFSVVIMGFSDQFRKVMFLVGASSFFTFGSTA
jgi:hypothetical protein